MPLPRTIGHRILRFAILLVLLLVVLIGLQATVLAFPQLVFFGHRLDADHLALYHDSSDRRTLEALVEAVDARLRASGLADTGQRYRVYYFEDENRYEFIARLAFLFNSPQGFALSLFDNTYVSAPRMTALGRQYPKAPRYSIFEGDHGHTIAHEIGHLIVTGHIGRSRWRQLPHWKQEGIPEYIANIGLIRSDRTASLANRLRILEDDRAWGGQQRWDRIHYEAGLLVEFLMDIRGYSLADVVADSVTATGTHRALVEWVAAGSP